MRLYSLNRSSYMKRFIASLSAVIVLGTAGVALADSYYWHVNWNDGSDTPLTQDLFLDGNHQYFVASNPDTRAPELWTTDTSFVWNNSLKQLEVGNISQDNIDGLVTALAGKASVSSVNSVSSNVSSLSSSVSAINAALASTTRQADFNQASTTAASFIKNKPTIGKAIDGTTARSNAFPIFKQVTVSSGNAVYHLTDDGTSSGNALCPTGPISDSLQLQPEEGSAPHAFGTPVWSNGNKTVTIPATKVGTVLGVLALSQSANGSVVRMNVWCY